MRTKIVVAALPADDFLQKVTRAVEDFRDHAGRVNTQYIQLKKLKDSLPTTSLLLQMDFADNFATPVLHGVSSLVTEPPVRDTPGSGLLP